MVFVKYIKYKMYKLQNTNINFKPLIIAFNDE